VFASLGANMEARCPICGSTLEVPDDAIPGELIDCNSCGALLEVFNDNGAISLREAGGVLEDWGE